MHVTTHAHDNAATAKHLLAALCSAVSRPVSGRMRWMMPLVITTCAALPQAVWHRFNFAM